MSPRKTEHPTSTAQTNQTPFERFKAAMSVALTTPKSSLPKSHKKTRKKWGSWPSFVIPRYNPMREGETIWIVAAKSRRIRMGRSLGSSSWGAPRNCH